MSVEGLSADAAFRESVALALKELPADASGAAVWTALGSFGVLRELYARTDGAPAAYDPGRLAVLLAALDEGVSFGAALHVCVGSAAAVPLLAAATAAEAPQAGNTHQGRVVRDALDGRTGVALAATEDGVGSDLAALTTTVDLEGPGGTIVLDGTKRWVTGAGAGHLLVLARHRPGRHFTSFTWALVPADAEGVKISPEDSVIHPGADIGRVSFDGVRLPREAVVGRAGLGLALFARHMAGERLAGALWAVALCRRVLADTEQRLSVRESDGRPLLHRDNVRQRLAGALVRAQQLRALCERLAPRVAATYDTSAAAVLKAAAGDTVEAVLADCLRLRGADGFTTGGLQELRSQAAVFAVGGGTTDVVLSAVADQARHHIGDLVW
ncbi:hypothetical protein GCM10010302_02620 [Streptomyces polychromogenes]|uniref:Acyl-CoA dehydrogenase n=1 Tax=Streptomyces polychromogenes TaxID=67342 RepID=A0ABP3EPQ1_9ACTN